MKKQIIKLFVILCLHLPIMSMAQVQVALHVEHTPSSKLSEWVDRSEIATLMINNVPQTLIGTQYKIEASLSIDGGLVVETVSELMPIRTFNDATEVLTVENIIPYEALRFYGNVKDVMISSGYLPPGNYQFCVRLVSLTGTVLSVPEQACAPMFLTDYQMPELIYPKDITLSKEMLLGGMFTWSQVTPQPDPSMGLKYIFALTEVQPGQTPAQAFSVNRPIIEEEVGNMTSYNLPWDTDIDPTKIYVWSVKPVRDDDTAYKTTNYGYVAFAQFSLDNVVETNNNLEDIVFYSKDSRGNLFKIKAQAKADNEGRYSGKGTVHIDWMNADVAVVFNEISLDKNNLLTDGNVLSQISKGAPRFPTTSQKTAWTTHTADNIIKWVNRGNKLKYGDAQSTVENTLETPIGIDFGETTPLTLAVTELVFSPQKAHLRGVNVQKLPLEWNTPVENMGFIMEDVEFSKEEILAFNDATVMENLKFQNINGKINFTFLKPQQRNTKGCYLKWNENGIERIGLALQTVFSEEWFKTKENGEKVMSVFTGESKKWEDLILSGKLSNAEIIGSNGMVLNSTDLKYDMSDTQNPQGINFPKIYKDAGLDDTPTFRGFYAEKSNISLPKLFKNKNGGAVEAKADNIIISDLGLIADVSTTNQNNRNGSIDYNLDLGPLKANIDTVNLKVFNSSVISSEVKGAMIIHVINDTNFRYSAIFQNDTKEGEYVKFFIKTTAKEEDFNLLAAKLKLYENSSLEAKLNAEKLNLKLFLNGYLSLQPLEDAAESTVGVFTKKPDYNFPNIPLQEMKIEFELFKSGDTKFIFDEGTWGFGVKNEIEGRAFKFSGVRVVELTPKKGEIFRVALQMGGILELANGSVSGHTTLGLQGILDDKLMPHRPEVSLDKIGVSADLPLVYLRGDLTLRKNHPVYGTGFHGNFNVEFTPIGLGMDADIFFGRVDSYNYWKVEVGAKIPEPGIPFMAGLSFRKFGGGAYYNMAYDRDLNSLKEYKFRPRKGYKGLIANTTIATMAVPNTFNADAKLSVQLNRRNGLDRVFFEGKLWAMSKSFTDKGRESSLIKGGVSVDYNPTGHIFDLQAEASARFGSRLLGLKSNASLHFYADGRGDWFFHYGTPQNVMSVELSILDLRDATGFYGYFMFGNKNVYLSETGFTDRFSNRWRNNLGKFSIADVGLNGGPATTGAGFAAGVGVDVWARAKAKFICDFEAYIGMNAEINGALLKYKPNSNCEGIYGWRASAGIGAIIGAGIKACGIKILSVNTGLWLIGEFPSPSYLKGQLRFTVGVWPFRATAHANIEEGERCSGIQENTGLYTNKIEEKAAAENNINKTLIAYTAPKQSKGSVNMDEDNVHNILPIQARFNFDAKKPMAFKYKYIGKDGLSATDKIELRMRYEVQADQRVFSYVKEDTPKAYKSRQPLARIEHLNNTPLKESESESSKQPLTKVERLDNIPVKEFVSESGEYLFYNTIRENQQKGWQKNSRYIFTLTAYLDKKVNGRWVPFTKNNGEQIKETRVINFSTFEPNFWENYRKARQREIERE